MRMLGHAFDISALDERASARRHALARSANRALLTDAPGHREGAEHVITGQRQEGKTFLAMRWLLGAPEGVERVLIVSDRRMADHLCRDYGMKWNDPRILSWRQLAAMDRRLDGVEYGVDETLDILADMLGASELPHLVTIATEPRDLS